MANELSALVEVGGDAFDRLIVGTTESLHNAVAGRVFRSIGPLAAPSRYVHDRAAAAAYRAVRFVGGAVTSASSYSIRAVSGADSRPVTASRRGRAAVSALNGLIGDVLEQNGNALAIPMAVRCKGADVPCERESLRHAVRRPTGRLAVFLHGLGETEERWRRPRRGRLDFGAQLRRDFDLTPVYIRYNSGLHISENGRRLAALLQNLLDAWPVAVDEMVLIGHSMGGLVARSACHAAGTVARRWPSRVRHLIALGSPHTGVPLEKSVHAAAWALRAVPETRPLARILDMRSAGIRDLRFGYLVDEDWRGEDPGRLMHDHRSDIPSLPGCAHTFITATLTRDARHPLGWLGGDLLVRTESAAGQRGDGSVVVPADRVVHVGAVSHFDLLDHPLVYAHIRQGLAADPGRPSG
ncbi:MAG TPA: alpha/beta hydrolase [Candidatus Dormibacteraeota bacterium]|nr:alpha/beta hydrolase [Candidatus Dormibacteraeota bacterium]